MISASIIHEKKNNFKMILKHVFGTNALNISILFYNLK